eukprot:gene12339-8467_t
MHIDLRILFYMLLNFTSSVSIVCLNKVVFSRGFPFGTLLTVIHFIITFCGLWIATKFRWLGHKRLPIRKVVPLCVTYSGFVALTNLSLVYNSVGFYQLMKVLTTPTVVVIEFLFYQKCYSLRVIISLLIVLVGVTIATVSDTRSTLMGTVVGLSAIIITCMNQIWVGTKQKELDCNGMQLLLYQAPVSALMLLPMVPILDGQFIFSPLKPISHPMALGLLILLSSICALSVNASIFLVIGKTSALTYNVFGQLKLVTLLAADFVFFGAPWNPKVIFGIVLTVAGVCWYTQLRLQEAASPRPCSAVTEVSRESRASGHYRQKGECAVNVSMEGEEKEEKEKIRIKGRGKTTFFSSPPPCGHVCKWFQTRADLFFVGFALLKEQMTAVRASNTIILQTTTTTTTTKWRGNFNFSASMMLMMLMIVFEMELLWAFVLGQRCCVGGGEGKINNGPLPPVEPTILRGRTTFNILTTTRGGKFLRRNKQTNRKREIHNAIINNHKQKGVYFKNFNFCSITFSFAPYCVIFFWIHTGGLKCFYNPTLFFASPTTSSAVTQVPTQHDKEYQFPTLLILLFLSSSTLLEANKFSSRKSRREKRHRLTHTDTHRHPQTHTDTHKMQHKVLLWSSYHSGAPLARSWLLLRLHWTTGGSERLGSSTYPTAGGVLGSLCTPLRSLQTPPGGFEDELPASLGRSASDKGRGQQPSTVNTRRKRILRRLRAKETLLHVHGAANSAAPAESAAHGTSSRGSAATDGREARRIEAERHTTKPTREGLRRGTEGVAEERRRTPHPLLAPEAVAAMLEGAERERAARYAVAPRSTVFGSDLDRLEDDYRRDWGQEQRERRPPDADGPLGSSAGGGRGQPVWFSLHGGGAAGKRLRWIPSSSYQHIDAVAPPATEGLRQPLTSAAPTGTQRVEPKRVGSALFGSEAETRRRLKRSAALVAGSSANQHLSAHVMAALAGDESYREGLQTSPTPRGAATTPSPFTPPAGRTVVRLTLNEGPTTAPGPTSKNPSSNASGDPNEGKGAGDLPATCNPHFPCGEDSHDAAPPSDGGAQREGTQGADPSPSPSPRDVLREGIEAMDLEALARQTQCADPLMPQRVIIDDSQPATFMEPRRERRVFASGMDPQRGCAALGVGGTGEGATGSSTDEHAAGGTARRYNAYQPRPWEEIVPILRDANYWDRHVEVRDAVDQLLSDEARRFREEVLQESAVDSSEAEYATQKLRKEMLLYFQAHPMNEMIMEPVVRLRELVPLVAGGEVGEDTAAGTSLRYHPEVLEYPSKWLRQHLLPEEVVGEEAEAAGQEPEGPPPTSSTRAACADAPATTSPPPRAREETGTRRGKAGTPRATDAPSGSALIRVEADQDKDLRRHYRDRYNRHLREAAEALFQDRDVPLGAARQIAAALGLDLIRTGSLYTTQADRRIIALCTLADHREHMRDLVRFKLQKLGVQPPPTMPSVEVPFRGGTHPHAMRVKAAGIAKRLLHRHVVRVQLTKFGAPREGFAVLQTILDEIREQCEAVHAYHTAGRIQSSYHEIYCYLYPSTAKSPKSSITHPSPEVVRHARDVRLLADEKEIFFDDFHNLVTQKERARYAKMLQDGTAWTYKDEGLSLQRQRAIKVMLGYLPKGNNEMYAARGDVNIPAPFRASHPTTVDRWASPDALDNLEQASRGAAVIGKRARMPISTMHDAQETEDQPSTLDRFYYRVQGSALEVGELKEALGLKGNRRKGVPLAPGFATLDTDGRAGGASLDGEVRTGGDAGGNDPRMDMRMRGCAPYCLASFCVSWKI